MADNKYDASKWVTLRADKVERMVKANAAVLGILVGIVASLDFEGRANPGHLEMLSDALEEMKAAAEDLEGD